jgi:methionyl-tRNA formyltransferase
VRRRDAGDGSRAVTAARTLFLGSGSFAIPILEALFASPAVEVVAAVTAPDRPAGRGGDLAAVPAAERARAAGLTVLQPARLRSPEAIVAIGRLGVDLGVLADYGRIVPPELLDLPAHGILNVHPSLLPRHRGATPIPATILAGDRAGGVSIIRMDAGLDTGPLVAAESWPLDGTETAPQLEARASAAGAALLGRSIPRWLDGSLVARPQGDAGATLTRPLRREDGRLDPSRPAALLERQVRAFQPWPGSFLETSAGRLVVWRASVVDAGEGTSEGTAGRPGELVALGRGLALATADGLLVLEEVQPGGGRRVRGEEFVRGHRSVLAGALA